MDLFKNTSYITDSGVARIVVKGSKYVQSREACLMQWKALKLDASGVGILSRLSGSPD